MDLDTYCEWAHQELVWFYKRLAREGAAALRASCATLGESGVRAVLARRAGDIQDYIQTPKNKRDAMLRTIPDKTERHAFLIAAAYKVRCGAAWLDQATSKGVSAGYVPSRSFLLSQAADAALALADGFPSLWPYTDVPDPFPSV